MSKMQSLLSPMIPVRSMWRQYLKKNVFASGEIGIMERIIRILSVRQIFLSMQTRHAGTALKNVMLWQKNVSHALCWSQSKKLLKPSFGRFLLLLPKRAGFEQGAERIIQTGWYSLSSLTANIPVGGLADPFKYSYLRQLNIKSSQAEEYLKKIFYLWGNFKTPQNCQSALASIW